MSRTSSSMDIFDDQEQEKLRQELHSVMVAFANEACPTIPPEIRKQFVREMKIALDKVALAQPESRSPVAQSATATMKMRLGLAPEYEIALGFHKHSTPDLNTALERSKVYLNSFENFILQGRSGGATQLSFQLGQTSAEDPEHFVIPWVISSSQVRHAELRRSKGTTDRKNGKPSLVSLSLGLSSERS